MTRTHRANNVQPWEADRSASQAREVRLVLPLALLEAYEELFRDLRRVPIGAQFRHELDLPRHAGGTSEDMAADHLQIGLLLHRSCPVATENDQRRQVPGKAKLSPCLTKSRV